MIQTQSEPDDPVPLMSDSSGSECLSDIDNGSPEEMKATVTRALKCKELSKDAVKQTDVKVGSFYAIR